MALKKYVVTLAKRVYMDVSMLADTAEEACARVQSLANEVDAEDAYRHGDLSGEDDWYVDRVEVEGDDEPPAAILVAA